MNQAKNFDRFYTEEYFFFLRQIQYVVYASAAFHNGVVQLIKQIWQKNDKQNKAIPTGPIYLLRKLKFSEIIFRWLESSRA